MAEFFSKKRVKIPLIACAIFIVVRLIMLPFWGGIFCGIIPMYQMNRYSHAIYDTIEPKLWAKRRFSSTEPKYESEQLYYNTKEKLIHDRRFSNQIQMELMVEMKKIDMNMPEGMILDFPPALTSKCPVNQKYDKENLKYYTRVEFYLENKNDVAKEQSKEEFAKALEYVMKSLKYDYKINYLRVICKDEHGLYLMALGSDYAPIIESFDAEVLEQSITPTDELNDNYGYGWPTRYDEDVNYNSLIYN